jgi:hypothetical protein
MGNTNRERGTPIEEDTQRHTGTHAMPRDTETETRQNYTDTDMG